MFDYFSGIIKEKNPTSVTVDVSGIGFKLFISSNTYEALPASGPVKIFAHLSVQSAMQANEVKLFGFVTQEERQLFRLLCTVTRVGPTMALRIVSGGTTAQIKQAIASENLSALARIRGVGPKTAQRIIMELKEMVKGLIIPAAEAGDSVTTNIPTDAIMALVALGYQRPTAEKSVKEAIKKVSASATTEEVIKKALEQI